MEMGKEMKDKIERDQDERERVRVERGLLVEIMGAAIIKDEKVAPGFEARLQRYAPSLLNLVEQIIINCQSGSSSRHQFADGHGSLAGCDMSLYTIDVALSLVKTIRGV